MPNTAASTLPARRRSVAGYLQAAGSRPHAVAKTSRVRELEARVADLETRLEAQAQMPVVVSAGAAPQLPRMDAATPAPMARPLAAKKLGGGLLSKARDVMRFMAD